MNDRLALIEQTLADLEKIGHNCDWGREADLKWCAGAPMNTRTIDGVEYLLGSAGSLILACDTCGTERFRESFTGFETCWDCKPPKNLTLIRVDEMETKWKPLWRSLGHWVTGDPKPPGFPEPPGDDRDSHG